MSVHLSFRGLLEGRAHSLLTGHLPQCVTALCKHYSYTRFNHGKVHSRESSLSAKDHPTFVAFTSALTFHLFEETCRKPPYVWQRLLGHMNSALCQSIYEVHSLLIQRCNKQNCLPTAFLCLCVDFFILAHVSYMRKVIILACFHRVYHTITAFTLWSFNGQGCEFHQQKGKYCYQFTTPKIRSRYFVPVCVLLHKDRQSQISATVFES